MPNSSRLEFLWRLREEAGINQTTAAGYCGVNGNRGRISLAAWESGQSIPHSRRRQSIIDYLWDHLRLRNRPTEFEANWEILVEEWHWDPISDSEWQRLTNSPRPLRTSPADSHSLPATHAPFQAPALTPHFVGREAEFAQLEALLTASNSPRIVALVGMGGIGKTTLAVGLAHRLRDRFRDGVLWGHAATSDPLDILQSWALAFGFDFSNQQSLESRASAIRMMLDKKRVLIILDDIRRLEGIRALLPSTDRCAVLITSRDQDVAIALNATLYLVEELQLAHSLQMLRNIVGSSRIDAEQEMVNNICKILQFLPLALEIIAKQIVRNRQQPLEIILSRLHDTQRRLDQLEFKDLSVRSSFELSWEILSVELRRIFTLLGIFKGRSFTASAFSALLATNETIAEESIVELCSLSLLSIETNGRNRQHPLLTDFALERLSNTEESYHRLAGYYLSVCQQSNAQWTTIEIEAENIIASVQEMFYQKRWSMIIDFAEILEEFWLQRGRYNEAYQGFIWAIQAAEQLNLIERKAKFLLSCGFVACELNKITEAEEHFRDVVELSRSSNLPLLMADAQCQLARIAVEQGDYEAVDELLSQCEDTYTKNNLQKGMARSKQLRGVLSLRNGDIEYTERICLEALTIFEQIEDIPGTLSVLRTLAENQSLRDTPLTVNPYAERFLELAKRYERKSELAEAYLAKAVSLRQQSQFESAISYAQHAEELARFMGTNALISYALYEQAVIYRLSDQNLEALSIGQSCRKMMQESNDEFNLVYCLLHLGKTFQKLEKISEALVCCQEALERAIPLHHPATESLQQLIVSIHSYPGVT